ncbi:hypothetical protein DBR32_14130 [Taibaiella sp. KBW10]|uniref:hypothetical protein n=1 Tax=Taibaiella sp. KBW10 TaxID=2153357 RepID=UPI000F5B782B|nr:hypothetical protein [Taibaiella sp. KBW10]RQO29721.1 hypothetical protein DBR32_14130 [Taibaiella sp. KBW10]
MKLEMPIGKMIICGIIGLILGCLSSCKATAQKVNKDLVGNVYTLDGTQGDTTRKEQVQAIRIDAVIGDTILVKYKIGTELFLDADFVWSDAAKTYQSLQALTYGSHAQYKSGASLQAEDKHLNLQLDGQKIQLRKRYNKPVDLKTHRDPYYAEDGFSLEP